MSNTPPQSTPPNPGGAGLDGIKTRILETAGQVFAEKGFDRATSKEICIRAGVNTAAVNYHFGSKEGLYEQVLQEAHRGIVRLELLQQALNTREEPEVRLRRFIGMICSRLFGEVGASWRVQVVVREMTAPTPALRSMVENEIRPKSLVLRQMVADYLGRPLESEEVSRSAMCIMAQFLALFQNRAVLQALFPEFDYGPQFLERMGRQILEFSLGGLERVRQGLTRDMPA